MKNNDECINCGNEDCMCRNCECIASDDMVTEIERTKKELNIAMTRVDDLTLNLDCPKKYHSYLLSILEELFSGISDTLDEVKRLEKLKY